MLTALIHPTLMAVARNQIPGHLVLIYYKDDWPASLLLIRWPFFFVFLSFFARTAHLYLTALKSFWGALL